MTHLQQVAPELIRSITENKRCYIIVRAKRNFIEDDTLILEAEGKQLPVIITNVQTEPGIMKGYVVLSFRLPHVHNALTEHHEHNDILPTITV